MRNQIQPVVGEKVPFPQGWVGNRRAEALWVGMVPVQKKELKEKKGTTERGWGGDGTT